MREQRSQGNQTQRLNQRVVDYYRKLSRRNLIFSLCLVGIIGLCAFGLFLSGQRFDSYQEKNVQLNQQRDQLVQERADILSGKIPTATKSFDDTLAENLANLEDYPTTEDNYQVAISGTDGTLQINRHNIFVSDNAGILSKEMKQKIYELNKQLAASTDGAQLEVVTIDSLPSGENIESYANKVFNQLGIGDAEQNNGVLYLIALEDREFRLEVGYGLEGLIPDGSARDIIDEAVDDFQDENYDQGVNKVIHETFKLMNTKTALVDSRINEVDNQLSQNKSFYWGSIISLVVLILVSLIFLFNQLRVKNSLIESYQRYKQQTSIERPDTALAHDYGKVARIKQTELYFLMKNDAFLILTLWGIRRALTQGKLLSRRGAKKMGLGRILIGDTLYSGNGDILTTAYLMSNYHSGNHSGGNSDGGGSSWGSFGGGSSGGGGVSGGW